MSDAAPSYEEAREELVEVVAQVARLLVVEGLADPVKVGAEGVKAVHDVGDPVFIGHADPG